MRWWAEVRWWWRTIRQAVRCRMRWCPVRIVSGTHGESVERAVWVGYQCMQCRRVIDYRPARRLW